jgi:hypothetical protein
VRSVSSLICSLYTICAFFGRQGKPRLFNCRGYKLDRLLNTGYWIADYCQPFATYRHFHTGDRNLTRRCYRSGIIILIQSSRRSSSGCRCRITKARTAENQAV